MYEVTKTIEMNGYEAENHTLTTSDDFILRIHRIPHGKHNSDGGIPIILLHGSSCSSSMWVINEQNSIAFLLADAGFDVWMANFRGNKYTGHVKYKLADPKRWDYSVDEIMDIDTPETIDYVLSETGYSQVFLLGESLGSTIALSTLAVYPEYNKKVAGVIAIGPSASCRYTTTMFIHQLSVFGDMAMSAFESFGIYRLYEDVICRKILYMAYVNNPGLCILPGNFVVGYSHQLRNTSRDILGLINLSQGTSTKFIKYMAQQCKETRGLRRFDYGYEGNLEKYNSVEPPEVTFENVTIPVVLIYAANDALASPIEVIALSKKLRNVRETYLVSEPMANHLDLIQSFKLKELLMDRVINHLKDIWNE